MKQLEVSWIRSKLGLNDDALLPTSAIQRNAHLSYKMVDLLSLHDLYSHQGSLSPHPPTPSASLTLSEHLHSLPVHADDAQRRQHYQELEATLLSLLHDEDDWIAAMATVCCELHHAFEYYHWTGFYRHARHNLLIIGPYQGSHGCLRISFDRGVCGAAARTMTPQLVPDVHLFPDHIACSSSTQSELVIPVITPDQHLLAVLDIDSNHHDAFRLVDQIALTSICDLLGARFAHDAKKFEDNEDPR
jgi:GAF domain-containing protein